MTEPTGASTRVGRTIASMSLFSRVLSLLVVVALIAVTAVVLLTSSSTQITAVFPRAASIYAGDRVKILGVDVGTIDEIEPNANEVRVTLSFDSKYKVPVNAAAVVVSPTLVSTRFIQLAPAYTGGPAMQDGAVIPMDRTSTPMEFDDLKAQLSDLSQALGPQGADKNGSLSRFLDVTAANADGQGQRFQNTIAALTKATDTLNRGQGDLFGTVRNLQVFVSALAANDRDLVDVNQNLASVTGTLAQSRQDLDGALVEFNRLAPLVQQFFDQNRGRLVETTDRAGQVSRNLAGVKDDLSTALLVAGPAVQNFYNIFTNNSYSGSLAVPNLRTPAQAICGSIGAVEPNPQTAQQLCATALGPILQATALPGLPASFSPLGSASSGSTTPQLPQLTQRIPQLLAPSSQALPGVPLPGVLPSQGSAPLSGILPNIGGGN